MQQYSAPTHDEHRVDATGEEFVVGPSESEAEELARSVQRWGRYIGRIAVGQDKALEVLMGLLDAGVSVDDVLDALVMHGNLPDAAEVADGRGRLQLTELAAGWRVDVG
jgi:hypothetical protein